MREVWQQLYLQKAPPHVVCSEFMATAGWRSVETQDTLAHVVASAELAPRYRQRVLKPLIGALQEDQSTELSERLLELYMEGLSGQVEDPRDEWSVRTFVLHDRTALRIRAGETVGGGTETGCVLWDAAKALSAWMLPRAAAFDGLHVVELGAGPGLAGLCLALASSARVTLTDCVPATLDNLTHNAAMLPEDARTRVRVSSLDWLEVMAQPGMARELMADVVVAADVVYEPSLVPPLLATIRELLCRRTARAIVAAEERGAAWGVFLKALHDERLSITDHSEDARACLHAQDCVFWCAPESIDRIHLLEVRLPS
ncbi:hypothetical protein AB1Y20_011374 [Prymnesium parvum]|uniref:Calmodulin-lysine N-methyltransferase n=1 Tax=Prymnesium parvum TaxID=97485 RepID=A0AB34IME7_PRYPA